MKLMKSLIALIFLVTQITCSSPNDLLACESSVIQNEIIALNDLATDPLPDTDAPLATRFINAPVISTVVFNNVLVEGDEFIKGDLTVGGSETIAGDLTINGTITAGGSNFVTGPASSTINAVARYADTSGLTLKDSAVLIDDAGNITIEGITKNGNTVSWPSTVGAVNTFLASDGAGNLIYATPAGSGNVASTVPFSADNRLIRTDLPSGSNSIQESGITLDDSNNIMGVNTLNATTVNANVNGTSTNFSGSLAGDVTGTQSATVVSSVGGQSAATIAAGTTLMSSATSSNTPSTLVLRDSSGNFAANVITADLTGNLAGNVTGNVSGSAGTTTNFTGSLSGDVTGTQSATVVSTVGGQTATNVANATVLSNSATDANTANALVRRDPSGDFSAGTIMASLIGQVTGNVTGNLTGNVTGTLTGNATTATTATNFTGSLLGDVTGTQSATVVSTVGGQTAANVAAGAVLANSATDANTANALVRRDALGNFSAGSITANLLGAASLNVLKAGDTMTGNLNMAAQTETRWQDAADGQYVGFRAPTTVPASYTLDWPTLPPTTGQILKATSATTTQWVATDAPPSVSKTYYVALNGSDSNDGSFSLPFRTISYAVSVANLVAGNANPVVIHVGAGIFVENNSGGPITITAPRITLAGSSTISTIVIPSTPFNDLFLCTTATVQFIDFTLSGSPSSTASAISVVTNSPGIGGFLSLIISQFQTGINVSSAAGVPIILVDGVQFLSNITGLSINNIRVIFRNSAFSGSVTSSTPANAGMLINGSAALVSVLSTLFNVIETGITVTGGGSLRLVGSNFISSTNSIIVSGVSKADITGCNFLINNSNSINVNASGAGTIVSITSASFQGSDTANMAQGTAVKCTTAASLRVDSSAIDKAIVGIACGAIGDTSSTSISANAVALSNCITDVVQLGSSSLTFVGGVFASDKISIVDATNVSFAAFDIETSPANLAIGNTTDVSQTIYDVLNNTGTVPSLTYQPDYYGNKGTVYQNPTSTATFNGTQATNNDASYYVVTNDRTQQAGISLISDTGNIGNPDNVRGWSINKLGTSASLAFDYSNNDTSGQAARGSHSVMVLNGFDNQVEFPIATTTPLPTNTTAHLIWGSDTNLYRSAAALLKTDGNLIVDGLTANRVVATDASKQLVSSATTDAELGFLAGTTSSIQTQINSKVAKAGDTMTGSLQLPAGSTSAPSLNFTGSPTTGLSAVTDILSLSTAGVERLNISPTGIVTINGLNTAGIVHTNGSGDLSTSLIVNADVSSTAAIVDTKLATIATVGKVANSATTATSTNTPNAIVTRDASGDFSAGTITANLTGNVSGSAGSATNFTGSLSGDVTGTQSATVVSTVGGQTAANVAAATILANTATATNTANAIVRRDASGNFIAGTITADLTGNVTGSLTGNATSATTATTTTNFSGSLTGDVTGTQSATVVANIGGQSAANVAAATVLANTATSVNTAGALVRRDGSGNFAAGTITASVTGASSLNVLKAGDTMTGSLQLPAGTTSAPSVNFTGSPTTGLSATTNNLSISTSGVERLRVSSAGAVSINGLNAAGVVHTDASGVLSTSLIVNADVSPTAAIVDTKLATIATAGKVANSATTATSTNTPSSIVTRDASGNFSAGTITANLTGNVSGSAGSATNFTGSLSGDVTGTQSATVVSTVGGQTAANVAAATILANGATSANAVNTIVRRDASGNFAAGTITANLTGNATTATTATNATNFTGSLVGDVTGTQPATIVSLVGGQTAANIAAATVLANTATSVNTAGALVRRDGSGNFAAGTITASVTGASSLNVLKAGDTMTGSLQLPAGTTSAPSVNFTGSPTTGLSATTNNLSISTSGVERLRVSSAGAVSINGLNAAGVVHTDASGVLSTSLIVNADVSPTAAIVDTKLATIATAGKVANSATTATSTNTPNSIVTRDASGNFSAGTITANLTGNVSGSAGSATNFTGPLSGDVTGTQSATVVSLVGGQTAANVAAATILANGATSANAVNTIVRRDASGNFAAGTITANLTGAASLNVLKSGDTMTGSLTMPAGTTATPSIQFTGSVNTGITAQTANTLSFDTNGAERMSISDTAINTVVALVVKNVYASQATQVVAAANNQVITVTSGISLLLLTHPAARNGVTINFPPSPIDGQIFTILLGTINNITFTLAGGTGGATVVSPLTGLNPASAPTTTANGNAVTYFYNAASNSWYRYSRG